MMLPVPDLNFGFNDAENYKRKEHKDLFNKIFLRNESLERLCQNEICFLIGEKGTGKTAYAVYLENNKYQNIRGYLKYIRETEYQKFLTLKTANHLTLSDYTSIWKVIIYLLLSESIIASQDKVPFLKKFSKFRHLYEAVEKFYNNAFSPEIIHALIFVESSKLAAKIVAEKTEVGGEIFSRVSWDESKFQTNLLFIQKQFEESLRSLKLTDHFVLFIDGIDIRPASIPYDDYLECVKGLANAVWSVNNDFFANIKDSRGRLRSVLLIRPDIFNSLGLQNRNNKIRDNSVLLDWRTTYINYTNSDIFRLADRLLSVQQIDELGKGDAWDYYFPFDSTNVNPEFKFPTSFISFLRFSLYRPRDIITMIGILQEIFCRKNRDPAEVFGEQDFRDAEFRRRYSEYLLGEIKDHLAFYYSDKDYESFLKFFEFLNGQHKFSYKDFLKAYSRFMDFFEQNARPKPQFCESHGIFLQFLYDLNVLCFIEETEDERFIEWCFRERSLTNISPKIKTHQNYEIHYGLTKALNLGKKFTSQGEETRGTVKRFYPNKGYGFIAPEDGSEDIFIHKSVLKEAGINSLQEGQKVVFDIGPGKGGKLAATRIKLSAN